jgi:ADP-dependent NAD(P)H-hydrate dehydratase
VTAAAKLDANWIADHPLPVHEDGTDKNERGRVLALGGSRLVPGAIRLTGEAAFRAGAGKVQIATIAEAAMALGATMPEAALIGLEEDDEGQIALAAVPRILEAIEQCDAFIFGPGMGDRAHARELAAALLAPHDGLSLVLDAAVIACAGALAHLLRQHEGRVVMTPHHGEAAALTGRDEAAICEDPEGSARAAAERFGAVMVLKSSSSVIAAPDGRLLVYSGGGIGLATGGSGDVLAGIIGGLLARGAAPFDAAAWGVWLHGEAGRLLAREVGPIGFLARELLPRIPRLMAR